ncbi:MAG: NAD(P)/FAD-dependent oxidoreductase [Methanosarcinales archaeon]|nr:NAD(P)/FAD-dependent oxidoreductase [Methanosarcinales archaeon]
MKTIIIGGGLTGLAAAYKLLKNGISDVTILEKDLEPGGMAASYHIGDYHIEKYYHHIFESDTELISLMTDMGLEKDLQWLKGTTGYHIDGKIYPMNTPLELLRSPLSILDLMRLARIVLAIKRKKDVSGLDDVTAKEWILDNAGNSVYERFFEPLLRSKFGNNHDMVSAAWLFGRIRIRSNRSASGERLGYLRGGFYQFIKRLTDSIIEMGGEVRTACEVSEIVLADGAVCGVHVGGGEYRKSDRDCDSDRNCDCDVVISTVPPHALSGLVRTEAGAGEGAGSGFQGMPEIPYQGTACALFGMDKPLLNNTYWLNIKSDVPFGAVVEHTNFLPVADYGEHLVYVTAYLQDADDPRWRCTEQEVIDSYLSGLERLFPDFSKSNVRWWRIARHIDTAPVYMTGYARNIPPYSTDIAGLYLAGMFSDANYPERSMNGSILAGFGCAEEIMGNHGLLRDSGSC